MAVAIGKKLLLFRWKHSVVWTTWSVGSNKDVADGFEVLKVKDRSSLFDYLVLVLVPVPDPVPVPVLVIVLVLVLLALALALAIAIVIVIALVLALALALALALHLHLRHRGPYHSPTCTEQFNNVVLQEVTVADPPIVMTLVHTSSNENLVCMGYRNQFDLIGGSGDATRIHNVDKQKV